MTKNDDSVFDDFHEFAANNEFMPMRELIYQYMRDAIITRRLPAGDHLVEEDLAHKLNASRTPVREALRKLESEGLVKHHRRRGVEVRQISMRDASDLYDLCAVLEGYAARLMAENLTRESIMQLKNVLYRMKDSIDNGDSAMEAKLHKDWHFIIYAASKNKRVEELLKNYHDYLQLFRAYAMQVPGRPEHSWEEHERLFSAIEIRDGELAEKRARNHVAMGKEAFLIQWKKMTYYTDLES